MAPRPTTVTPFICVTCEAEVRGPVTFHVGLPFCCAGCVAGGPCLCSYDLEPAIDPAIEAAADRPIEPGREPVSAGASTRELVLAGR
jgi:hypothetical protein